MGGTAQISDGYMVTTSIPARATVTAQAGTGTTLVPAQGAILVTGTAFGGALATFPKWILFLKHEKVVCSS